MLRIIFLFTLLANAAFAQTIDSMYIDLDHDQNGNTFDCKGITKRHITKAFSVPDHYDSVYKVEIYEDSISILSVGKKSKWYVLDTLSNYTWFAGDTSCTFLVPNIQLLDFNKDGHTDLKIWINTNVNGNEWVKLFLYNPADQQVKILQNEAENGTIWDAPKYRVQDSTIYCTRVAGVWGLSYESVYKLNGFQAFPLDKKAHDNTEMDLAGRGAIYRHYVGYKSKWKLIKKTIHRAH